MRMLRKLAVIAAILGFAAAFVWLDNDKGFKQTAYEPYTLHNTAESGCSLAFRYIKESRGKDAPAVRELNRMIEFAELEPNAVVFRIAPQFKPGEHNEHDPAKSGRKLKKTVPPTTPVTPAKDKPLLTPAESTWVHSGGRLVLALENDYGPLETAYQRLAEPFEKTYPLWPDVKTVRPTESRTIKSEVLNDAHTLFTLNGEVYAARLPLGKGEVIVLSSASPFNNAHLDDADNLKLLANLAPATRPIYFDEFVHELRETPGVIELLQRWGLGMALLILAVGSLFAFWRARSPIGAPEDDHTETRTQAIDFVGSLAPLYNRALAPHQALALHYKNFVQAVSAQSGLRGPELAERIRALLGPADAELLSGKRPLLHGEFELQLKAINEAYGRLERAHRR